MAAAISRTNSGSNDAAHDSGTGYTVAPQAAKPARHSSCAIAGIPNLLLSAIRRWLRINEIAPAVGSTGAVPNGRVS